ncbi:MAG: hypothetical protein IH588_07460 [Anaerolineales bacterium]|nr:hypothetical protein [Anaerolineales bacterium]
MLKSQDEKEERGEIKSSEGFLDKIIISDALILAAIPVAAYLIVFFYEWGYFSVFNIPIEFISFDMARIIFAMISIIAFVFSFYYLSELFLNVFDSQSEPIKRRLKKEIYPLMIAVLVLFTTLSDWKISLIIIGLLLFSSIVPFITPLFTQRKVKGYLAKLSAEDALIDIQASAERTGPIRKLASVIGWKASLGLMIFGYLLYLTYVLRSGSARTQKEFRVVSTSPERIVLWIYNDFAICSSFDRVKKQVNSDFIVLKIGDNPNIEYNLEQVGPLIVKSITSTSNSTPPLPITPTSIVVNTEAPHNEIATITPLIINTKDTIKTNTPPPASNNLP